MNIFTKHALIGSAFALALGGSAFAQQVSPLDLPAAAVEAPLAAASVPLAVVGAPFGVGPIGEGRSAYSGFVGGVPVINGFYQHRNEPGAFPGAVSETGQKSGVSENPSDAGTE